MTDFQRQIVKEYITSPSTMRDLAELHGVSKSVVNKYIQRCAKEHPSWGRDIRNVASGKRHGAYSEQANKAIRSVTCIYVK